MRSRKSPQAGCRRSPAVKHRVEAGDRLQPAWGLFLERIARYGLPADPRVRHLRAAGPLATLVIAYRH